MVDRNKRKKTVTCINYLINYFKIGLSSIEKITQPEEEATVMLSNSTSYNRFKNKTLDNKKKELNIKIKIINLTLTPRFDIFDQLCYLIQCTFLISNFN